MAICAIFFRYMEAKYLTLLFLKVPKIKLTKKESQCNINHNKVFHCYY